MATAFQLYRHAKDDRSIRALRRYRDCVVPATPSHIPAVDTDVTGKDLVAKVERIEMEVVALERRAAAMDMQPSDIVRLATAETLASHILIPALAGFREQYPMIHLEIATGIGTVVPSRREADLVLRLVQPTEQDLICRTLVTQANGLYAADSYLRRHAWTVERLLGDHRLIGWERTDDGGV